MQQEQNPVNCFLTVVQVSNLRVLGVMNSVENSSNNDEVVNEGKEVGIDRVFFFRNWFNLVMKPTGEK